ncbi:low-specificity L-threonine aldolase [Paraferrimonas sedimenticola]|uniref:Threonine aldolase n=1 Tax=Paraferrimonas sedimenticola TaxID=375674 RepID=A0AA37RTI1_9GAMM|nr:low-specificity L-threonine aldolase [Paraferrimonas sedimenticola]GLP95016.1 threonine aldolase [Paraferrimonas sedimenticola]
MRYIDFRSDTVTQPTDAMRQAMANAEVGDDVFGDDPSINRLEESSAERYGFEACLFVPSGTQANLLAIMAHCQRGDEYICGQDAHNYRFEGGGAAVLGSVQPQPLANNPDGSIDLDLIKANIKPDDSHFARTRLLSLENTIGGKVLPMDYLAKAQAFAFNQRLKLHLDGARVMNAAVKLGVNPADIMQHFDSVSVCLSKGLSAPVGSILLGDEATIGRARRLRKMVGGGMRQAGCLAAAGQLALDTMVERLAEDHDNAAYLAKRLNEVDGVECDESLVQTNMVFAKFANDYDVLALGQRLKDKGVVIYKGNPLRLVTHKDVSRADVDTFIEALKQSI